MKPSKEFIMHFCRSQRTACRLTAAKWARLLGVSLRTVRYWESGMVTPRKGRLHGMSALRKKLTAPGMRGVE